MFSSHIYKKIADYKSNGYKVSDVKLGSTKTTFVTVDPSGHKRHHEYTLNGTKITSLGQEDDKSSKVDKAVETLKKHLQSESVELDEVHNKNFSSKIGEINGFAIHNSYDYDKYGKRQDDGVVIVDKNKPIHKFDNLDQLKAHAKKHNWSSIDMSKHSPLPNEFNHKGELYQHTGKNGTDMSTGEASAEYEVYDKEGNRTGKRKWRNVSGKLTEETLHESRGHKIIATKIKNMEAEASGFKTETGESKKYKVTPPSSNLNPNPTSYDRTLTPSDVTRLKMSGHKLELIESIEHEFILNALADKDINASHSNGTIKVHKDDLAKAKSHLKKLGFGHVKVTSGLNESEELEEMALDTMKYKDHALELHQHIGGGRSIIHKKTGKILFTDTDNAKVMNKWKSLRENTEDLFEEASNRSCTVHASWEKDGSKYAMMRNKKVYKINSDKLPNKGEKLDLSKHQQVNI